MVVPRNIQAYLHRNIKRGKSRRPRKCHELPRGGNNKRSGRPNGRMHAERLKLGLNIEIGDGNVKELAIATSNLFKLMNRRLYDAGEGFPFGKGSFVTGTSRLLCAF